MSLQVDFTKQLGSFSLRAKFETNGETLGLLGASGCGKSMTLKCIAGIEHPDSGRIVLDGVTLFDSEKHIDLAPQKRQVGYLFQNYALFPNMTVRQNILCGMHSMKDPARKEKRYREAMELLRLDGLEYHRPAQLSGGQAQRTALARILVSDPKLLMLDEPFSALDSHLRMHLQIELKELLSGFGKDVLMVTHNRDEAYDLCRKIAIMENGEILSLQETKALFANPGSVCAAILTGCKNVTPARKTGEYEIEAPDWGIRLRTAVPVRDDVCGVGIRAHYWNPKAAANRFAVRYENEMEEPFECVILFRAEGQKKDSDPIWWRIPKEKRLHEFPKELGIAPENVLLLYR